MIRRAVLIASVLSGISPSLVVGQQHVKLSTSSARFTVSLTSEPDHTFSTHEHFLFESVTSKLIHTELSNVEDVFGGSANVVTTSVHVERMRNHEDRLGDAAEAEASAPSALELESVVSVTSSDVGIHQALERSPIAEGMEDESGIASILTEKVSPSTLLKVLVEAELVPDDARVLELSFAEFDGSVNERGIATTETDIVSKQINDGWPMFMAGVMITLVVVSIVGVVYYIVKKESGEWPFLDNNKDDGSSNSVHYRGDVDIEDAATTASGVLGLKGHHPQAGRVDTENAHPNERAYRRSRRGLSSSSSTKTGSTSYASTAQDTARSGATRASSKHPLGIASMKKLESFLTPQKQKSDAMVMYDVERLTRT